MTNMITEETLNAEIAWKSEPQVLLQRSAFRVQRFLLHCLSMMELEFRPPHQPWVLAGQIEHLVADLTVKIAGDVTLDTLQKKLAEADQWLPMDGPGDWSVASLLNLNSTGPLRLGFGAWRDLLLGVQFLNGNGELVTAGGIPLKNVAGYDLGKFMVGQAEVFGKIVAIITRTYRRPSGAILAKFAPEAKLLSRLLVTPCRPTWAISTRDHLLLGYLGNEADLEFFGKSLRHYDPDDIRKMNLDEEIKYRRELWRPAGPWGKWPWVFRASVPPARVMDFVQSAGVDNWVADAAFGIVLGGTDERLAPAFRGAAASMGGSLQCRSAADGSLVALTMNPEEKIAIEKLKNAFDPEKKLTTMPRS
ncbi:MAG TPA: FAD-binding protein [Tepidisphaeraceae bacterium]|nr:FAD-binding protein [Tepidisphaeraceae bacterium]